MRRARREEMNGKEEKRKRNIVRDKRISVSFVNSVTRMTDMMAIYTF